MVATLALLAHLVGPVFAILIAAPAGPDDTCPNAHQVLDALQVHVPGVLVPPDRPNPEARPDVLRMALDIPADGTVVRFTLVDARGDVQLRRTLPGLGRGRPVSDCAALAETIATIVERYLISVPFQARETEPPPPLEAATDTLVARPPPPAAPPADEQARAARAYAAGAWRASSAGPNLFEVQLGGEVDLTRGARRLGALLRAAVDEGQLRHGRDATTAASLRRFSGRLGLSLALPAGRGAFQLVLEGGLDLFFAQTTSAPVGTRMGTSFTPVGEAGVGYRVTLLRHVFLRPQASIGFAIVKYDARYVVSGGVDEVDFPTPRLFSTFGLAIGAVFR